MAICRLLHVCRLCLNDCRRESLLALNGVTRVSVWSNLPVSFRDIYPGGPSAPSVDGRDLSSSLSDLTCIPCLLRMGPSPSRRLFCIQIVVCVQAWNLKYVMASESLFPLLRAIPGTGEVKRSFRGTMAGVFTGDFEHPSSSLKPWSWLASPEVKKDESWPLLLCIFSFSPTILGRWPLGNKYCGTSDLLPVEVN